jgi:8-oxo-dGTP pyrophosphatase MutT (NUDIX family)
MNFNELLDKIISEAIKEPPAPVQLLNEIDDETYDYIVDQAENLKAGSMNSYFGGQQRVVIPLVASENEEIQRFYDEIVIPLASKGLRVDLADGVAIKEVETQRGKQERRIKLGKVIGKQLPEETQKWWNTVQAKFLGNPEVLDNKYSIVISQNPVDVARMSDHRDITSCHSPGSDYFECALADARRAGAIAYLIDSDDVPYIESHINDAEVFADRDRGVEGVTPLARVRLRRFDYVDPDNGFIDALLVPESRIYGRSVPGFLNSVIDWAREEQDNHPFFEKKLDPRHIYHRGGSYSDSAFSAMFNNLLGLENIELNDKLKMYPQSMPMMNDTTDEQYVNFTSSNGIAAQIDYAEERMREIKYDYLNHEDIEFAYDLEWDDYGEHPVIESWKITLEFDIPLQGIINSEFVKNNESVNIDPDDPRDAIQDEINHRSVWEHIETAVEEAYENSDHYNEYLEQPEIDAQAELIRFGSEGKLVYRIKLIWEGGGELIPLFAENIAMEISNIHNYYDELKIEIIEKLVEEEVYSPTKYQKFRQSIEWDEEEYLERIDGELVGHFRLDVDGNSITAYSHEKLDNYPLPGIRKVGSFPEWGKPDESPPLAHVMGFDDNNFKGMTTRIAYNPKAIVGMLLNPMWSGKVMQYLEKDLKEAAKAAEAQLTLAFNDSEKDTEKEEEWGTHENALEVLKKIYVYFSADVIYTKGSPQTAKNSPSRNATGGLYFKFNETDNEYTLKGLVQFLKYFDENYDVVQAAIQKVWDEFVEAYNENAPIVQEEGLHFLRQMIQEAINEEMDIKTHPQRERIMGALDDPNYLVHFSDLNKVGINPKTKYKTPAGIYGWHWTTDTLEKAAKNKLFGSKRNFAHLMKVKDDAKILWLGDDDRTGDVPSREQVNTAIASKYPAFAEDTLPTREGPSGPPGSDGPTKKFLAYQMDHRTGPITKISPEEWLSDPENVTQMAKVSDRNYAGESKAEQLYDYVQAAANVLERATNKPVTILTNSILRAIGYDGVIDTYGKGIIHKNEPQQGFFTHGGGLETVATLDNKIYSLPTTAVYNILTNSDAPADAIEKALTAVLESDKDLVKGGEPGDESEIDGEAILTVDDRLDLLDYATKNNKNLTTEQLERIYEFIDKLLSGSNGSYYMLVGGGTQNQILAHPNVSQERYQNAWMKELTSPEPDTFRVKALIRNPEKASPQFLNAVASGYLTKNRNDQVAALSNPKMPAATLKKYVKDYPRYFRGNAPKWRQARAAMTNPNLPEIALLDLLYDEDGIVYDNDIMRDIVLSPNLHRDSMEDILEAIKDKEKIRENKIMVSDIIESFVSAPHVPEDLAIQVMEEYPELVSQEQWEMSAGDIIRRALQRNYTATKRGKVSPKLLMYLRDLYEEIKDKPEYDLRQGQGSAIEGYLTAQGAYKKKKNESQDFPQVLKNMISEQIKVAIGEKQEDSPEVTKVVIQDGNRVLLIKRSDLHENFPNKWDLPGGHIHVGEDKEVGLRREVEEETGLVIGEVNELYPFKHETFYITNLPEGKIKLSPEHTEYKMVDIREVPGYDNLTAKYKDAILTAMEDVPLSEHRIISEMFVKGDPDGENIVAYRENIWRMGDIPSDEVREDINKAVGIEAEWEGFYDLKEELDNESRMDVLFGSLLEGGKTLYIEQIGSFKLDPKSSILVKKVVKELGARKVVYASGFDSEDEEEIPSYGAKGKIADVMYHGTTSNYLENILKFGLVPGESKTNYEGISHPNAVFFSSRIDEALHHAIHTAGKVGGDPVIVNLNVPDPDLLIPDYDVDMGAGDTGCFDYICHTLRSRQAGNLDTDSFSLSREVGVYGYKGRVPASAIFAYDILMNAEDRSRDDVAYASVTDFTEATPEEAATYIETKDNLGMGALEYPEWYEDEEE